MPSFLRPNLSMPLLVLVLSAPACVYASPPDMDAIRDGIWIDRHVLRSLPTEGPAWERLVQDAARPTDAPDLSNQEDMTNIWVLAKALVYGRTGESRYREDVIQACLSAMGSEEGGRSLALGRNLMAYVVSADLVGLPTEDDIRFRAWLGAILDKRMSEGRTLRQTHEQRPNNWGTHAGASRLAVAAYLGDAQELEQAAKVFKGWLGDRRTYSAFEYGDLDWQADPSNPVGINPVGAVREGRIIDGVLADDQRRAGGFTWPPPQENYVYEALQGALAQAVILQRAGYPVIDWENRALLRAFVWLHEQANFPAEGDDTWQPHLVNAFYQTHFPTVTPSRPGKNAGYTDWTHAEWAHAALPAPQNVRVER